MQYGREINGKLCDINCGISTMYKTVHTGAMCIRHERSGSKGWAAQSLRIIVILRNYVGYLCIRIQKRTTNESTNKLSLDKRVVYELDTIRNIQKTYFDKISRPPRPVQKSQNFDV